MISWDATTNTASSCRNCGAVAEHLSCDATTTSIPFTRCSRCGVPKSIFIIDVPGSMTTGMGPTAEPRVPVVYDARPKSPPPPAPRPPANRHERRRAAKLSRRKG